MHAIGFAAAPHPAVTGLSRPRATMPPLMCLVPQARADGLAADAGSPPRASVIAAGLLAAIALGLGLGHMAALVALVLLVSAVAFMAWLCRQQIGGQTGRPACCGR